MFGRGFTMMRNPKYGDQAVCGPDGKLFEAKEENVQAPAPRQ
jgi:hypothetical protein